MSALAEPLPHATHDDALARRNALVLAAAQALAGGNNTVIVSTASIVGAMLAPNAGLATLPITAMVIGMWLGTLPVGWLARRYGRRAALQTGSAFGVLSGLISCIAVLHGSFALLLFGTFCGGLYAAAHMSYRFAAADTASDAFRPKAVSWVLAGGVFAAVIGPQLVIFTKDLLSPHLFAASYLGQSACAADRGGRAAIRQGAAAARAKAGARPPADGDHAHAAFRGRGRLRRGELRHDEHGDDLGAARHDRLRPFGDRRRARHPVARAGDVCAELHHRLADRALRRRARHRQSGWR